MVAVQVLRVVDVAGAEEVRGGDGRSGPLPNAQDDVGRAEVREVAGPGPHPAVQQGVFDGGRSPTNSVLLVPSAIPVIFTAELT